MGLPKWEISKSRYIENAPISDLNSMIDLVGAVVDKTIV
jgi:hypothetical protein